MKERVDVAYEKMQGAWNSRIEAKEKFKLELKKKVEEVRVEREQQDEV